LTLRGQSSLNRCKPPFKFPVGSAQYGFRISLEMAAKIDHREKQIADLRCSLGGITGGDFYSISSHSSLL
jgi:hypothetical protein